MNPLEQIVNGDKRYENKWRSGLTRVVGSSEASLSRFMRRLIWPKRLKHMRYLAPGVTMARHSEGCWSIYAGGKVLAKSEPLQRMVVSRNKPVSIVATGPSALVYPWETVRNSERMIIAVNGAPTMLRDLDVRPDMLVVTDREFAITGSKHLAAAPDVPLVIELLAAAALAATEPKHLSGRPFVLVERVNMWHGVPSFDDNELKKLNDKSGVPFVFPPVKDPKCRIGWSHKPELGIFSGRTVVFGALQIAIGLGATDVEIIGMDLSGVGRAYAEGSDQRPTQLQEHYQSYILPSFHTMRQGLAMSNVSVKNLSPVCPLPDEIFTNTKFNPNDSFNI